LQARPILDYVITPHAAFEMKRRGIHEATVRAVLSAPEQQIDLRAGRVVVQSRMSDEKTGKKHLLRVFVDVDRAPAEVVTVYRTSKISKYWRTS
jgi:hypothetical protein